MTDIKPIAIMKDFDKWHGLKEILAFEIDNFFTDDEEKLMVETFPFENYSSIYEIFEEIEAYSHFYNWNEYIYILVGHDNHKKRMDFKLKHVVVE